MWRLRRCGWVVIQRAASRGEGGRSRGSSRGRPRLRGATALQQIVRRGSTSSVRYRRAMMLLAAAGGNRVPVIAELVRADEDTVRDVIHRFNEIGLGCLDPRWAGDRPRLLSPDDEDFVVQTATTRPTKLGQPFSRWSIRKLVTYLHRVHSRAIHIGREALRCLLARRGVTFQAHQNLEGVPRPSVRRQARPNRARPGRLPGPDLRVRRVRPARDPAHRRISLGRLRPPRKTPRDLPPHPRRAVLPRLLLDRRRHPVGRQPS